LLGVFRPAFLLIGCVHGLRHERAGRPAFDGIFIQRRKKVGETQFLAGPVFYSVFGGGHSDLEKHLVASAHLRHVPFHNKPMAQGPEKNTIPDLADPAVLACIQPYEQVHSGVHNGNFYNNFNGDGDNTVRCFAEP